MSQIIIALILTISTSKIDMMIIALFLIKSNSKVDIIIVALILAIPNSKIYYSIKKAMDTPVSRHFRSHQVVDSPAPQKIYILSLIKEGDNAQQLRDEWEQKWMARLNTWVPKGLNIQD